LLVRYDLLPQYADLSDQLELLACGLLILVKRRGRST